MKEHQYKRKLQSKILLEGYRAANSVSTARGRSNGGWIRLARVEDQDGKYVVAIRPIAKGFQLGCSCSDWVDRRLHTRNLCTHQRQLLKLSKKDSRFWLFKAGRAFIEAIGGSK